MDVGSSPVERTIQGGKRKTFYPAVVVAAAVDFVVFATAIRRLFIAHRRWCCRCSAATADAVYLCRIYRFILTSLYVLRLLSNTYKHRRTAKGLHC